MSRAAYGQKCSAGGVFVSMRHPLPTPPPEDLIGSTEALTILGYRHRSSISILVRCGDLTPVITLPSGRLFRRSDVQHLAAAKAARRAS